MHSVKITGKILVTALLFSVSGILTSKKKKKNPEDISKSIDQKYTSLERYLNKVKCLYYVLTLLFCYLNQGYCVPFNSSSLCLFIDSRVSSMGVTTW